MVGTHMTVFDDVIPKANEWLDCICERLGRFDRRRALHALRAVLHALRDRLSADQAAALAAQLPLLVRGLFYEGWHPRGKPSKERSRDEFLAHVASELVDDEEDVAEVTAAVLDVLARHVSAGEIDSIKCSLPADIRRIWE